MEYMLSVLVEVYVADVARKSCSLHVQKVSFYVSGTT